MKNFYVFLLTFLLSAGLLFASAPPDTVYSCVSTAGGQTTQVGGLYLPSTGTINVLIIFAQFPDDNYDINNSSWPKGGAPLNPINGNNTWIDQTWSTNPTQGSLTHYFNEMSYNKLHFIGNTVSVITPHSRQWYLDNNKKRYDIQKETIQQLDQTMDFSQYDNWTYNSNYNFTNRPDGTVEMVFFVWRNIANDLPNPSGIYSQLNMGRYGDVGWPNPNISVDNGQRTIQTYWAAGGGGGATLTDYFSENMFRFIIHEYAHYLEGGNNMHVGFGFWGMLSGWGIKKLCS